MANRYRKKCGDIDTHEILKSEIYKQDRNLDYVGTLTTSGVVVPPTSQKVGFTDYYFYFDSFNAQNPAERANGVLTFDLSVLNSSVPLDNVIMIQPTEFYFPKPTNLLTTDPNYYFFRKVYLRIESLPQTQAIKAQNDFWYHFEFDVTDINSIAVKLIPTAETTTYFFKSPITAMSLFRMSFWVPNPMPSNLGFKRITLPMDVVTITAVPGTNPGRFTIGDPLTSVGITSTLGALGVPLPPGITVWISASASGVPAQDAIINNVNGNFVTNLAYSGVYYYFEIAAVDLSLVAAPFNGRMTIGKNRIGTQFRFTVVNTSSNTHVSMGHD